MWPYKPLLRNILVNQTDDISVKEDILNLQYNFKVAES